MEAADVIDITRDALWVIVVVGTPVLLVALLVGVAIGLLQALTQIQEMTLSFIPKILIVFLSLMIFFPFMMSQLIDFGELLFDRIIALGG